jgi:hypothetical protein
VDTCRHRMFLSNRILWSEHNGSEQYEYLNFFCYINILIAVCKFKDLKYDATNLKFYYLKSSIYNKQFILFLKVAELLKIIL